MLCGKQAVDGDTAQVGPEMAEHLGIPQITGALSLSYEDGKFVVVREKRKLSADSGLRRTTAGYRNQIRKRAAFASIKGKMKHVRLRFLLLPLLTWILILQP